MTDASTADTRPAIALDVDQVLVEWLQPFISWMLGRGYEIDCPAEEVPWATFHQHFIGQTLESVLECTQEFNESPEFAHLPLIEGALEGVRALRWIAGNEFRLIAVSSAGRKPVTTELRCRNLEPFGLDHVHIVPLRESKAGVLVKENVKVLIDDTPRYVNEARDRGILGILFDQPHNRGREDVHRAFGWKHVPRMVRETLSVAAAA